MAKRFLLATLDQPFLLPPSLQDWLPADHLARFVAETVSVLDLSTIRADYERRDGRGQAAYHPEMMVRLLVYAYATGVRSSRKIEQATRDSLAFRFLAANHTPDHTSIAEFRRRYLQQLSSLFVQVLRLCEQMQLVTLGQIAIDGTKVKANATKRRTVSYQRLSEREQYWHDVCERLLAEAEQTDGREQTAAPPDETRLPPALADAQQRLAELRQAKKALDEQAQQKLTATKAVLDPLRGRKGRPKPARDEVEYKRAKRAYYRARTAVAQHKGNYNFVDPESQLMQDGATHVLVQGYNAQAAVDGHAQVIVATAVTTEPADNDQLGPMLDAVTAHLGRPPAVVTADRGYWNTKQIAALETQVPSVTVLVPPESDVAAGLTKSSPQNPVAERMRARLQSAEGQRQYGRRQTIVEPVFGVLKEQLGMRRFSFRGREKVAQEWQFVCGVHNLRKLYRHTHPTPSPRPRTRQNNAASALLSRRCCQGGSSRRQRRYRRGRPVSTHRGLTATGG